MKIRISKSGITEYRGNYKRKRNVPQVKKEENDKSEIPNKQLAEDFKDLSISGEGLKKEKLQQIASDVLPTTKKLQKFIKFNI